MLTFCPLASWRPARMSSLPSPLTSARISEIGLLASVIVSPGMKLRSPCPSRMLTVLSVAFAATISSLPSPLTSPTAILIVPAPGV
jgi:hypothetical protein